jgi:tetratricopeptide (TPR) repeat protein
MEKKLETLLYISLPDKLGRNIGSFTIDPAILLPVEAPEGAQQRADSDWDLSDISWEMIVSGMLKLLAWEPEHQHATYYRNFVLALQPDVVSDLTRMAIVKTENLDYNLAEELFRAAAEIDVEDEKTILNLALLYEQKMDLYLQQDSRKLTDEALEGGYRAYMKALKRHPDSPKVRYNAAYFFLKIHNPSKAKEHLAAFLNLVDPTDHRYQKVEEALKRLEGQKKSEHIFTEAFDAIRMNREEEGIDLARRFLEENPESWDGWFLLGWGLRRLERYDDAKKALLKALDLEDSKVDIYNELAICLIELSDYDTCSTILLKALEVEPENTKIISNMAVLYMRMGKPDLARERMEQVLELDPEDPLARNFLNKRQI